MLDTPARPIPQTSLGPDTEAAEDAQQHQQQPPGAPPGDNRPRINATTAALGSALASAAAAWMVGGLFRDFAAHLVALLGVAIGSGFVLLSTRGGRGAVAQYLVVPVAVVAGVILVVPDMTGGKTVLDLVREAIGHGGLLQPPVSFDPGWRPLLVILFALLSAAAAGVGAGLRRPKLGVAVPAPLLLGAAVIQPPGSEIASAAIALVLVVLGLTLAFGAELGGESGQVSAAFELPRLLRAGAIAGALAVGIAAVSSFGFLFPQPNQQRTVPPQRPQQPAAVVDKPLFTVKGERAIPLRLGVLDTYDPAQHAWLLPGYDANRLVRLQPPAAVPDAPISTAVPQTTVTFSVSGADGHAMPSIPGLDRVSAGRDTVSYDPQTQTLSLADRPLYAGMSYAVTGVSLDLLNAQQLDAASPPGASMSSYTAAPSPPNQVVALLTSCAQQAAAAKQGGVFEKLQCVRKGLYDHVVAAGSGVPTDVTPTRVGQMLDGGNASPFEITAAEALLARWAGVPSRIGYGYYNTAAGKDGSWEIRPINGAMWTEVYFGGYGWVPVIGTPPKAKPSTSNSQHNQTAARPSDKIQMMIYIPIRRPSVTLLFVYVRYWLFQVLPPLLLLVLLALAHPLLFKLVRTRRRRRWAAAHGLEGRIVAAYADFRDRARDLTIGDPGATPLKFLAFVEPDTEHRELAWLVTRALWGDLRRDLQPADAAAAESMARSVGRRLDRAQPVLNRISALIARSSLRQPYSTELPNAWYERELGIHPLRNLRGLVGSLRRRARGRRRRPALAGAATMLTLALLLCSCGQAVQASPRPLDTKLVPSALGAYTLTREKGGESQFAKVGSAALVSGGLLYSIHATGATLGSIEVTVFKPEIDVEDINDDSLSGHCTTSPDDCQGHAILKGFQSNLGSGHFHRLYYGGERAYVTDLPDQRVYVWFPPGRNTMVILDLISQFTASGSGDAMFQALLDAEHGRTPGQVPLPVFSKAPAPPASPSPSESPAASASPSPSASGDAAATPGGTP